MYLLERNIHWKHNKFNFEFNFGVFEGVSQPDGNVQKEGGESQEKVQTFEKWFEGFRESD